MASRFQVAALVASPSYPNSIAWSEDNFVAVASGHLVTILNPAVPFGPRGLIRVPTCEPCPTGRINRVDLLTGCMLPIALSRDHRPCIRSISWSQTGMAPNYGCLLAICTVEGRVKIYRPPCCDFSAEWIELQLYFHTIFSDRLFDYLAKINFGELDIASSEFSNSVNQRCADKQPKFHANDLPDPFTGKQYKRRKVNVTIFETIWTWKLPRINYQILEMERVFVYDNKPGRRSKKVLVNSSLPLITAEQYASCSALLSSLVIAWSPVLWLSSKICSTPARNLSNGFSILAVGGKSGKISVWRIHVPEYYSIEQSRVPNTVTFIGILQAHNSWVTTISLTLLGSKSNPQVLLASGSSNGSVKIWLGKGKELLASSGANNAPFSLLKEVISVNTVPVSVLSLVLPSQSMHKMLLAVGKESGSLEVWTYDISNSKCDKAGSCDAHDCIVTGLAWAFDGCCLYTCSQDNYVRAWVLHGSSLCEVALPSNTPGSSGSNDFPRIFDSGLGVAASPGDIAHAMVRNVVADALDPMLHKAIVEFLWIGGQQKDMLPPSPIYFAAEAFIGFSTNELINWRSNILWCLTKCENLDKPLVVWDIMAALLEFKQSAPEYVDHILVKWLSATFLGSHAGLSIVEVLTRIPGKSSKTASRKLHLLNIICRRIMLCDLKAEEINFKVNLGGSADDKEEHLSLWMEHFFSSEKELRERLVGLSLAAFITSQVSDPATTFSQPGFWHPVGVAQTQQWVALNHDHVSDQLKVLSSEIKRHERRLQPIENRADEQCVYCSELVPFDSPEVAHCGCSNSAGKDVQNHRMARCAVSMQVCPATPLWFCKCCCRWTSKLPPETLFAMRGSPLDYKSLAESCVKGVPSKPFCPFCGILLQRLQPDFLLNSVTSIKLSLSSTFMFSLLCCTVWKNISHLTFRFTSSRKTSTVKPGRISEKF